MIGYHRSDKNLTGFSFTVWEKHRFFFGMNGKIEIIANLCKTCLLCIEVCKKGAIKQGYVLNAAGYTAVIFDEDCECNGCKLCAIRCPEIAIEVYREK